MRVSLISSAADGRQRRSECAFIKEGSSGGWRGPGREEAGRERAARHAALLCRWRRAAGGREANVKVWSAEWWKLLDLASQSAGKSEAPPTAAHNVTSAIASAHWKTAEGAKGKACRMHRMRNLSLPLMEYLDLRPKMQLRTLALRLELATRYTY